MAMLNNQMVSFQFMEMFSIQFMGPLDPWDRSRVSTALANSSSFEFQRPSPSKARKNVLWMDLIEVMCIERGWSWYIVIIHDFNRYIYICMYVLVIYIHMCKYLLSMGSTPELVRLKRNFNQLIHSQFDMALPILLAAGWGSGVLSCGVARNAPQSTDGTGKLDHH